MRYSPESFHCPSESQNRYMLDVIIWFTHNNTTTLNFLHLDGCDFQPLERLHPVIQPMIIIPKPFAAPQFKQLNSYIGLSYPSVKNPIPTSPKTKLKVSSFGKYDDISIGLPKTSERPEPIECQNHLGQCLERVQF